MIGSQLASVAVAEAELLDVGATVDRRYLLKREIARGGAGAVFEAEHLYTKRSVALKLLVNEHARSAEPRARLLREAWALTTARHPGVVAALDAGETQAGNPYLVMELLEGRTLEGILAVRRRLTVNDTIIVGRQLLDAIAFAHDRAIVHRDIKPSNIFICRDDTAHEVTKVFDFGIARIPDNREKLTLQGSVLGTPEYMAPEQLLARESLDHLSDIYSIGVTLYECLAGVVPFEGSYGEVLLKVSTQAVPSLHARCPDVPPEVAAVIEKALAREPAERFQSARAFSYALTAAVSVALEPSSLLGLKRLTPAPAPPSPAPEAPKPAAVPSPPRPAATRRLSPGGEGPVRVPLPPPLPAPVNTRRRFARAPYVTPVRILRENGSILEGRSEDISVGGLLVLAQQAFENQEHVRVRFALPVTGELVELPATARWVKMARGTGAFGLEFTVLAPEAHATITQYVTALGGQ
jgi:serine/threonine-protein kinase